jgi:hypothetical protein
MIPLEFAPQLVEGAVLLRVREDPLERNFYRSRDRLYLLPDGEQKEESFQKLYAAWFVRFGLERPIREALQEQPLLQERTRRCCVLAAGSGREEGADLAGSTILIRVAAARLLDAARFQPWLRHELMHVADMLDPAFAYSPEWPAGAADPAAKNLWRERYRVLWDVWIDGRLERRGWLPEGGRRRRFEEFAAAFPSLGLETEQHFAALFDAKTQTHASLLEMARPAAGAAGAAPGPFPCPLCRFPTYKLQAGGPELAEIVPLIQADFPGWLPAHGLCRQCADLYEAREMSRAAAALLPGI